MNRRAILALLPGIICLAVASAASAKELAEIEDELSAQWDKVSAYSAKIEMKGQSLRGATNVEISGKGTLEGMKKNASMVYRLELDQTLTMGESAMPNKMLVVHDGTGMFTQTSMMGQTMVFKSKADKQSQIVSPGGREAFKQMHEQYDIKVLPGDNLNGEPVYVFELRPKQDAEKQSNAAGKPQFDKTLLSLSRKTGFPIRMLMFGQEETPLMTVDYRDYKIDPKLDPARFTYTPPPGAVVMDAETFKQMGGTP
ncbi:MAG TPA: hypothetical protein PLM14_03075 [Candidatus Hydrogenedentes bacterium]|nr:hypothetical protein [Candidatus Hydrogenedentota bacterium]HQE81955.1 hypothetical protein [Candidatus Hydrogenedentota bacterium]HQH52434.1 hypothetical protein [Candidatus Hydrogenedentota bacterium]HQM49159.1 hypothetical protein [Candidatus Hydrogenedentota bacterium]